MWVKDEIYKWKLLAQFKGRPDVTKSDFTEELTGINFANLVYPVSIAVIHHIALERAESYRDCFKVLFNEEKSLFKRVKYFNEETLKIYRELVPEEKFSHHQDERTIAAFLTYHDPEKYSFYKDSYYQKACKLLEIKAKPKGEKYVHFMELLEEFIVDYISEDKELLELINPLIDSPDCFQDKNHLLLAQDILYQTLDNQIGLDRAYWRIGTTDGDSTGAKSYWDEMKNGKNVCIGWPELGNLNDSEISSKNDIESLFTKAGTYVDDKKNLSRKSGEVFDFYNNVKIGDVVLSQIGTAILGIGIIADEYYYDAKSNFPHRKQAEWKIVNPVLTNKEGLRTTVFRLKELGMIKQIEDLLKTSNKSDNSENNINTMKSPLNLILFGPPGTGKTYNSISKAVKIANPKFDLNKPRKMVKEEFERLMKEGQVVFTTFHQSMSYEDFIEGIKPIPPKTETNPVIYNVQDGIFKRIAIDAGKTKQKTIEIDAANQVLTEELFEEFYLQFVETLVDSDKEESNCVLETQEGNKFSLFKNTAGSITILAGQKKAKMSASMAELKSVVFKKKVPTFKSYEVRIINEILKDKAYKESDADNSKKPFVLIIDEINRGNVSQIFGELITLIEEDKRLGNDESLEVILPYSKEKFGVPSNLYIIGTMNTADRSVEAIDTALRRRFSFEEVPPKYDLEELKYEFAGVKGFEILQTLNRRIEKLLDKDHQIGHSYLMKKDGNDVKEMLLTSFYRNIIPLLQEYFFGDFGKIGLVLGQGFVQKKEWNKDSGYFAEFDYESVSEFDDRPVYEIIDFRNRDNVDDSFAKAIQTLMIKKIG